MTEILSWSQSGRGSSRGGFVVEICVFPKHGSQHLGQLLKAGLHPNQGFPERVQHGPCPFVSRLGAHRGAETPRREPILPVPAVSPELGSCSQWPPWALGWRAGHASVPIFLAGTVRLLLPWPSEGCSPALHHQGVPPSSFKRSFRCNSACKKTSVASQLLYPKC